MILSHPTFRVPSLLSVAQLYGIPMKFISSDLQRGVLVAELEDIRHADYFLERCITVV
jgi:tRNA (guanine10-N2)-methyltransferase